MGRKKVSGIAEAAYAADAAMAAGFDQLLADARAAENGFRKAQAAAAPNHELYPLAMKLDAAITDVMRAAYAAARAEIGPRGYDDQIYRRKARAKSAVRAWIDKAERLLTLREIHRLTGIPPVPLSDLYVRMAVPTGGGPPAKPLTPSAPCCTVPAMAASGIKFAYENAVRQSSLQLDAMDSLDTKAGVIIAALLVVTGFLFHTSQPTWVRIVIAVLLAAALITSGAVLVTGWRRRVAPSPEQVSPWTETLASDALESLFLRNVIAAFDADFKAYTWKTRFYIASILAVAAGAIFIGSVRLAGVV